MNWGRPKPQSSLRRRTNRADEQTALMNRLRGGAVTFTSHGCSAARWISERRGVSAPARSVFSHSVFGQTMLTSFRAFETGASTLTPIDWGAARKTPNCLGYMWVYVGSTSPQHNGAVAHTYST